jgi:hypothetical protein
MAGWKRTALVLGLGSLAVLSVLVMYALGVAQALIFRETLDWGGSLAFGLLVGWFVVLVLVPSVVLGVLFVVGVFGAQRVRWGMWTLVRVDSWLWLLAGAFLGWAFVSQTTAAVRLAPFLFLRSIAVEGLTLADTGDHVAAQAFQWDPEELIRVEVDAAVGSSMLVTVEDGCVGYKCNFVLLFACVAPLFSGREKSTRAWNRETGPNRHWLPGPNVSAPPDRHPVALAGCWWVEQTCTQVLAHSTTNGCNLPGLRARKPTLEQCRDECTGVRDHPPILGEIVTRGKTWDAPADESQALKFLEFLGDKFDTKVGDTDISTPSGACCTRPRGPSRVLRASLCYATTVVCRSY